MNLDVFWPNEANYLVHGYGLFKIAFSKGLSGQGELPLSSKTNQVIISKGYVCIYSLDNLANGKVKEGHNP